MINNNIIKNIVKNHVKFPVCGQWCDSDLIIKLEFNFHSNYVTMHTIAKSQLSGNMISLRNNKQGNCLFDYLNCLLVVFWAAERSTTKSILSTAWTRCLQRCLNNWWLAVRVRWPELHGSQTTSFGAVTLRLVAWELITNKPSELNCLFWWDHQLFLPYSGKYMLMCM